MPRSLSLLALLSFALLLALTACGLPGAPLPPPTPTPASPLRGDVIAVYEKSGCFTGIDDTLTVHSNGTLELRDRQGNVKAVTVSPDTFSRLRGLFAQSDFDRLAPQYQASGADLCTYRVTAMGNDGSVHTVQTMDAANHPQILTQIIQELDFLRQRLN